MKECWYFNFTYIFSVRGLNVQVITYSYSIIHAFASALNFQASYNLQLLLFPVVFNHIFGIDIPMLYLPVSLLPVVIDKNIC